MLNVDEPVQDGELRNEVRVISKRLDGVDKRLDVVEQRLQAVEVGLAKVQAMIEHVVTKGELHAALNAQTWKIMGFGLTIVAAAFALARYL